MTVKNRLVMPPMVRNYADKDGMVTPRYVAHIERIAKGGTGMTILEASFIHPRGKGFMNELGIHDDAVSPGLKKLAVAPHKRRAVAAESPAGPTSYFADTVVLCLGSFPNDGLVAELSRVVKQVRTVGDAVEARRVTEAVAEGALAALDIR